MNLDRLSKEVVQEALGLCSKQIHKNLESYTDVFIDSASTDGIYKPIENKDWTNGFWTGQIWLAYEFTSDPIFESAAMTQVDSFLERIEKKISVDHHDMGFLYTLSCVAAYKLKSDEKAKKAALMAADQLMSRFQPVGQFIQAWGQLGAPENYRLIIDCLLNVPLLHWTYEETGDKHYEKVALQHTKTALAHVIRPDYSTHHTYYFDKETGKGLYGETCQGYDNKSVWARGQAWGVYGLALSYRYTKNPEYLEQFKAVTAYYLKHLPQDMVPYWDMIFTDGSDEPRDSSSAAIVVCGLLEMMPYLKEDQAFYMERVQAMMASLIHNYMKVDLQVGGGLLAHGTYSKKSPYNTCYGYGVDEYTSWGDYFFMEALTRLSKDWICYW